jgi:hypothetical protein
MSSYASAFFFTRSLTLHASLTVIAMHIDDIASFITLPIAAMLVLTLVMLIATVVLVTLALRRDGLGRDGGGG